MNDKFVRKDLRLSDLKIHSTVQRHLKQAHVNRIAEGFDPDAFGEIYVVRGRGKYFLVWDGQHRVEAARKTLGEDQRVPCRIYERISDSDLALHCLKLNYQKAWNAIDTELQRQLAREPKAIEIRDILAKRRLRIDHGRMEGVVQAPNALNEVMDRLGGSAALSRTIDICQGAWGREPDAYSGVLIKGVAMLCNINDGNVNDKEMTKKLLRSGDPLQVIGRARQLSKTVGISVPRATCEVLTMIYNRGRRTDKLPSVFQHGDA